MALDDASADECLFCGTRVRPGDRLLMTKQEMENLFRSWPVPSSLIPDDDMLIPCCRLCHPRFLADGPDPRLSMRYAPHRDQPVLKWLIWIAAAAVFILVAFVGAR